MGDNINESFLHQYCDNFDHFVHVAGPRMKKEEDDARDAYYKAHPPQMHIGSFFSGLIHPFPGFDTIDVIKKTADAVGHFI